MLVGELVPAPGQGFHETLEDGEGRPQLVAHDGQELGPVVIGPPEGAAALDIGQGEDDEDERESNSDGDGGKVGRLLRGGAVKG